MKKLGNPTCPQIPLEFTEDAEAYVGGMVEYLCWVVRWAPKSALHVQQYACGCISAGVDESLVQHGPKEERFQGAEE